MNTLKNANRLYHSSDYQTYLKKIAAHEVEREFCRHNLAHFLDVARIVTIKCLENHMNLSRDLIYTTALLHDIGRFEQYEKQIPHEVASHQLAIPLLAELDFDAVEKSLILTAILNHRNSQSRGFDKIFYESDKLSRNCLVCPAQTKCDWSDAKKNMTLHY
ncbi:HD domain-containing protein [Eubacteriaceae bacterium ES2]|nr:HD domain-containing protein [Eubacteriaceae bacterium ES2]